MEWVVFTCLLTLAVSGLHQGVKADKPRMIPEQAEITIQEGDPLEIKCYGDESLQFSTEKVENNKSENYETVYDPGTREHRFVFSNTTYANTGWYACAEKGVVIENTDQTIDHPDENISWIYVYVNSSTPFAEEAFLRDIVVKVGDTAVIPCRPTSSNLGMKLRGDIKDFEGNYTYDPKIGFILHNVGVDLEGCYSCIPNASKSDMVDCMYILTIKSNMQCTDPTIDVTTTMRIVSGTNHTLRCSVTASPDDSLELNWTAPVSVPENRLVYNSYIRDDTSGSDSSATAPDGKQNYHIAELTIMNIERGDSGEYTCHATGNCETTDVSKNIDIKDEQIPFINVTVEAKAGGLIEVNEGELARWRVYIDTYPPEFNKTWFKPDSSVITNIGNDSTNNKYSYRNENMWHYFEIANAGAHDIGQYQLTIQTSANKSDEVLELSVKTKPDVQILNLPDYYVPMKHIFDCKVIGPSLSNVTWQYLEYPDYPSMSKCKEINIKTEYLKNNRREYVSHANITINMTGNLICMSCNPIDCSRKMKMIRVSDTGVALGITASPSTVTEDDTVNLTCSASVYEYHGDLTWAGDPYERLASENEKTVVIKTNTSLMHQSILQIHGINKSNSGKYSCKARKINPAQTETTHHNLIVEDASEPIINGGNVKNSSISVNLTDGGGHILTCITHGRPIPKVTWLKDNDPRFTNDTRFSIEQHNTVLRITRFKTGDSGRYMCRAENRLGVAEAYTDIIVKSNIPTQNNVIWISLICLLIVIIIIVITYMGIRVHRERALRKVLCEAGLTHFENGAIECLNPDLPVDDQAELLPYDKKWEFPSDMLKIGKQLGSGAFGVVMKAEARGICTEGEVTTVAVKMVRSTAEPSYMKALASELKIMIHLGRHLNVVNLLGACTKNILTKRELHVIVEYCRFGNLHNYLQRHRSSFINQIDPETQKVDFSIGMEHLARCESIGSQNRSKYANLSFYRSFSVSSAGSNGGNEQLDYRQATEFGDISMSPNGGVLSDNSVQPGWRSNYRGDYKDRNLKPICTQDLLCWAWQVSRGMEYLSSRNVLHGDLAARNILLADDNIVKICDFGLAKNMYKDNNYKKKGDGPLPIKWMAIESIRDRIYSTQSDVWSFGIVLWEFFTLAQTPYPGMEAETQYDRLIEGYRMPKPIYATDEMHEDIIKHCWKAKPSLRPTFPELVEKIGTLLNEGIKLYYRELDTPYLEMNTAKLQDGQNDYLTMMSAPNHDYHNSPDPMSETHPDSDYLPMSPVNKTTESAIFSPRPNVGESHFEFPSSANNASVNSDSEECAESIPMLKIEDPYLVPVDVHQRRADFAKQGKTQTVVDNDYCNMPNNRQPSIAEKNDRSPDIMKISDQNIEKTMLKKNHDNDSAIPIMYSGNDNYINMPQRNTDRAKNTADSFSNPSYVVMSKSENDSQFV